MGIRKQQVERMKKALRESSDAAATTGYEHNAKSRRAESVFIAAQRNATPEEVAAVRNWLQEGGS